MEDEKNNIDKQIKDSFESKIPKAPDSIWGSLDQKLDDERTPLDNVVSNAFSEQNISAPDIIWKKLNRQLNIDQVWSRLLTILNRSDRRRRVFKLGLTLSVLIFYVMAPLKIGPEGFVFPGAIVSDNNGNDVVTAADIENDKNDHFTNQTDDASQTIVDNSEFPQYTSMEESVNANDLTDHSSPASILNNRSTNNKNAKHYTAGLSDEDAFASNNLISNNISKDETEIKNETSTIIGSDPIVNSSSLNDPENKNQVAGKLNSNFNDIDDHSNLLDNTNSGIAVLPTNNSEVQINSENNTNTINRNSVSQMNPMATDHRDSTTTSGINSISQINNNLTGSHNENTTGASDTSQRAHNDTSSSVGVVVMNNSFDNGQNETALLDSTKNPELDSIPEITDITTEDTVTDKNKFTASRRVGARFRTSFTVINNNNFRRGQSTSSTIINRNAFVPSLTLYYQQTIGNRSNLEVNANLFNRLVQKQFAYEELYFVSKKRIMDFITIGVAYTHDFKIGDLKLRPTIGSYYSFLLRSADKKNGILSHFNTDQFKNEIGIDYGVEIEKSIGKICVSAGFRGSRGLNNLYRGSTFIPDFFNKTTSSTMGLQLGISYKLK